MLLRSGKEYVPLVGSNKNNKKYNKKYNKEKTLKTSDINDLMQCIDVIYIVRS